VKSEIFEFHKRACRARYKNFRISKELNVMAKKEKLTERQQLVYDSIVNYQMHYGDAPSIRELCVSCNLASTSSVYAHLKKLQALGYIRWWEAAPRAIVIV
jgi:repressor LexA